MKSGRASNACDYCRSRKIKCDEVKPNCFNCDKKKIACTYIKRIEPSKFEKNLNVLYEKVNNIEEKLELLISLNQRKEENIKNDNIIKTEEEICSSNCDLKFDKETNEVNFNLFLNNENYLIPDLSPDLERRNSIIMINEDEYSFKSRLNLSKIQSKSSEISMNLNDSTINELLDCFLNHVYPFYPIVCEKTIINLKNEIFQTGLVSNSQTCTFLLVLSLGEIIKYSKNHDYWQKNDYQKSEINKIEAPPGYEYFWLSRMIIGRINASVNIGFETIVIQFLSALYYFKIGQISDYQNELLIGSSQLYKFIKFEGGKHKERDLLYRLYWVFLHLERNLKNMGQLKRYSTLVKLQSKMNIPKGCENIIKKSIFDNDSIYSTCFMQNIFLSNIIDKSSTILQNLDLYKLEDIWNIWKNFELEINNWKIFLPFNFNWDTDLIQIENLNDQNKLEIDLLKLKYYLTYITSCNILIIKLQNIPPNNDHLKIIEKCITFTIKSLKLFSKQELKILDPNSCFQILCVLKIFQDCCKILDFNKFKQDHSLLFLNFDHFLSESYELIQCFALHSPLIDHELNQMKNQSLLSC